MVINSSDTSNKDNDNNDNNNNIYIYILLCTHIYTYTHTHALCLLPKLNEPPSAKWYASFVIVQTYMPSVSNDLLPQFCRPYSTA